MKPPTQFNTPGAVGNGARPRKRLRRVMLAEKIPTRAGVTFARFRGIPGGYGVRKQLCEGVERRSALATAGNNFDRFSRFDDASQTAYAKYGSKRVKKCRKALTCRVPARVTAQSSVTASGHLPAGR